MRITPETRELLKTIPIGTPCILKTDSWIIKEWIYDGVFMSDDGNFRWDLSCSDWKYLDILIDDKNIDIAIWTTVYYDKKEYNYLSKINEKYSLLIKNDIPMVALNFAIKEIETLTFKI